MDNLNETSAEHTEIEPNDIDLVRIVKVEREKILSDLAQLTQSFSAVFSKPAHRKRMLLALLRVA
ncbi:hypothetical protein FACS1894192_12760 [Bacilli bacterium]|nr:hypothetical protein FACS1894192_12760 [Bacilli bacterium]